MLKPWTIESYTYPLKDKWLTLRADRCKSADGRTIDPYYVVEASDWVNIVALDGNGRVLITRQYRHAAQKVCFEIPCGEVEPKDSSPETAIERELLEETGYKCERVELVQTMLPNPARFNNKLHCFLGWNAQKIALPRPDETESIQFSFFSLEEVIAMIETNRFPQALHIASLLIAMRKM